MAEDTPKPEKLVPLFLFDDEPVKRWSQDELDLQGYSRMVASAAIGSPGPFNIGVFATWGLGKTSLLNQAKTLIDDDPDQRHVVTAWVNAWRFEQEDHPIVPLVATIVDQVERKLDENRRKELGIPQPVVNFLERAKRGLRAVAYGFSARGKGKVPGFGELEVQFVAKEMIERDEHLRRRDPLLEQSLYYRAYEVLDNLITKEDEDALQDLETYRQPKIVVFIDDLDRCLPDKALRVLESLKLVFSQRGFVFVLAVDRMVIDSFLRKRYTEEFGMEDYARGGSAQYLDKIIQLPFNVPSHERRFAQYVERIIQSHIERASRMDVDEHSAFEKLKELSTPLALGCGNNPRTLIRTLNRLLIDRFLWSIRLQSRNEEAERKDAPDPGQFLLYAAISRTIELNLRPQNYNRLWKSDATCEKLAELLKPHAEADVMPTLKEKVEDDAAWQDEAGAGEVDDAGEPRKRMTASSEHRREARDLIGIIDGFDSLKRMLAHQAGQDWLRNHPQRHAVEEFLDSRREDESAAEGDADSRKIIEEAIREKLGDRVANKSRLTEQDYQQVTKLNLNGTAVSDLTPLVHLTNLQDLNLSNTAVSDLTPLAYLTNLQFVDLRGTAVSDLTPLVHLTNLQDLYLSDTAVSDLAPLKHLTNLPRLDLSDTAVSDLTPLAHLTNLQRLNLNGTAVSDLTPLHGLTNLQHLYLSSTAVSDLAPLQNLTRLRILYFRNTQVTNDDVERLKKHLPDCDIRR